MSCLRSSGLDSTLQRYGVRRSCASAMPARIAKIAAISGWNTNRNANGPSIRPASCSHKRAKGSIGDAFPSRARRFAAKLPIEQRDDHQPAARKDHVDAGEGRYRQRQPLAGEYESRLQHVAGTDEERIDRLLRLVFRLAAGRQPQGLRSEEHTSELQSQSNLVCRLLL